MDELNVLEAEQRQTKPSIKSAVIVSLAVISVLAVVLSVVFGVFSKAERQLFKEEALKELLNVSQASTSESVYNGVAKVFSKEEPTKLLYYVSYSGTVKSGINLENVTVSVNHGEKQILLTIPQAYIKETAVDSSSPDFIYLEEVTEPASVTDEILQICKADLDSEIAQKPEILSCAQEDAENMLVSILKSYVNQVSSEYKIVVER